jgi:hypothetical protein
MISGEGMQLQVSGSKMPWHLTGAPFLGDWDGDRKVDWTDLLIQERVWGRRYSGEP